MAIKKRHPLTRWRFDNGFSLARLGRKVKASAVHLSDIERGMRQPSIDLAKRLQRATGLTIRTFRHASIT